MYIGVESELSPWQSPEMGCAVVLYEVFAWLPGAHLARAGAVCRAWRCAVADPTHWRRLLRRVKPHTFDLSLDIDGARWRQEYVDACAGWALAGRVGVAQGAGVSALHASLAPAHDALAIGADDASLAVWVRAGAGVGAGGWRRAWRRDLSARGWTGVARVQWAARAAGAGGRGPRLLLAGPRALVRHWELMVVQLDDHYQYESMLSRVRCSGGAAGCWVGDAGDAFLSLELEVLGPRLACTAVWLNAASQETHSEYAGVTTLLLRIFNEDSAQITHALVAADTLLAGSARGLAAWRVRPHLPRLDAGAPHELAERERRRRASRARALGPHPAPAPPPPPPDERAVRALCVPPERECRLTAPLAGLALHHSGAWVCAVCADGVAACVCVRSLTRLREFRSERSGVSPLESRVHMMHYVQPSLSDSYVASPAGAYSPLTSVWSARSGVETRCGAGRAGGAEPATCALLAHSHHRPHLFVLAGDTLFVWRSRASRQAPPASQCSSR